MRRAITGLSRSAHRSRSNVAQHAGMTTSLSLPPTAERRPGWVRPLAFLLVVAIPTAVLSTLTLTTSSPPMPGFDLGRSGAINYRWWTVGFLLVVPVFLVARAHPRLGAVAALLAGVPQFVIVLTYIARSNAALKAAGGEQTWGFVIARPMFTLLAYAQAAFMMLFFAIAAVAGTGARRRQSASPERFFG
jgi:hypothetical protein